MQGATKRLFQLQPWVLGSGWGCCHRAWSLLIHLQAYTSYSPPPCCMWFNPYWCAVKTEASSSAASSSNLRSGQLFLPSLAATLAIFSSVSDYFSYENSGLVLEAPTIQPHPPHSCCSMLPELTLQAQPCSYWPLYSQQILPVSLKGSQTGIYYHSHLHCALAFWSLDRLQYSQTSSNYLLISSTINSWSVSWFTECCSSLKSYMLMIIFSDPPASSGERWKPNIACYTKATVRY